MDRYNESTRDFGLCHTLRILFWVLRFSSARGDRNIISRHAKAWDEVCSSSKHFCSDITVLLDLSSKIWLESPDTTFLSFPMELSIVFAEAYLLFQNGPEFFHLGFWLVGRSARLGRYLE